MQKLEKDKMTVPNQHTTVYFSVLSFGLHLIVTNIQEPCFLYCGPMRMTEMETVLFEDLPHTVRSPQAMTPGYAPQN